MEGALLIKVYGGDQITVHHYLSGISGISQPPWEAIRKAKIFMCYTKEYTAFDIVLESINNFVDIREMVGESNSDVSCIGECS